MKASLKTLNYSLTHIEHLVFCKTRPNLGMLVESRTNRTTNHLNRRLLDGVQFVEALLSLKNIR